MASVNALRVLQEVPEAEVKEFLGRKRHKRAGGRFCARCGGVSLLQRMHQATTRKESLELMQRFAKVYRRGYPAV